MQSALLVRQVREEAVRLVSQLRSGPIGVRSDRWEEVELAPLAKSHLATAWGVRHPSLLAALFAAVDESIEKHGVPRRIKVPRRGGAFEELQVA